MRRAAFEEAIKKGDSLAWAGHWEESLVYFRQAAEEAPEDLLSHSSLGIAYAHLDRHEDALAELSQVLRALPQDVLTLARISECLAKLGKTEDCAANCLLLGEAYIHRGDQRRAIAAWRKLLSFVPDHQEGRAKLAAAIEKTGDVKEAAAQYAALALIMGAKDQEQAKQTAWKALELDPGNAEAKRVLGTQRLRGDRVSRQAEKLSTSVTPASAGLDELLVDKGGQDKSRTASMRGESDAAQAQEPGNLAYVSIAPEAASGLTDKQPKGFESEVDKVLNSSERFLTQGKYLAALDECYQAVAISPACLDLHVRIGEIQVARGRTDEAVEKYSHLASTYLVRDDVERAVGMHRRIAELCPDDFDGKADFIRLLLQTGKTDEALEQQLQLAENRAKARQVGRAVADFREAIRMAPGNARPHLRFARVLSELGRTGDAMREYEEAEALEPGNVEAALQLSIANRLSGGIEEFRKYSAKLMELAKGNPGVAEVVAQGYLAAANKYNNIPEFAASAGLLLAMQERFSEAIPYLEGALAESSEPHAMKASLCRCYLAQGMHTKALARLDQIHADRAGELTPFFKQEVDQLVRQGRWAEATPLLEALKQRNPHDDSVFMKLAEAHFRQGRVANAIREFDSLGQLCIARREKKRAVSIFQVMKQLAPKNTMAYVRLGELFAGEGMKKQAIAEYEVLADLQAKQGQTVECITTNRRIVELDPDSAKGRLGLGEALFAAKEYAEASAVFRQLLELDPANAVAQTRLAAINSAAGT